MSVVSVYAVFANAEEGERIGRQVVEERLAACVNVHGAMRSTYRWKGQIECDAERQVVIKTTREQLAKLEARLRALHPYELPEFVAIAAEASDAYANWVSAETM